MKTSSEKKYRYPDPSGKLVSRQRIWQLKQKAQRKCSICSAPVTDYPYRCNKHQLAQRIISRIAAGGPKIKNPLEKRGMPPRIEESKLSEAKKH